MKKESRNDQKMPGADPSYRSTRCSLKRPRARLLCADGSGMLPCKVPALKRRF